MSRIASRMNWTPDLLKLSELSLLSKVSTYIYIVKDVIQMCSGITCGRVLNAELYVLLKI